VTMVTESKPMPVETVAPWLHVAMVCCALGWKYAMTATTMSGMVAMVFAALSAVATGALMKARPATMATGCSAMAVTDHAGGRLAAMAALMRVKLATMATTANAMLAPTAAA
jgi:hypothetical protein